MIYPNLKLANHFRDRVKERSGINLDGVEEMYILRSVNEESVHLEYQEGNKEIRVFRIDHMFYMAVIGRKDQVLVTMMRLNKGKHRNLFFKRFEREYDRDSSVEIVKNYEDWRRSVLQKQGWNFDKPLKTNNKGYNTPPKSMLLWGGYSKSVRWNGSYWFDVDDGTIYLENQIWGYRK